MNSLLAFWILAMPVVGLFVLSFVFRGSRVLNGSTSRYLRRDPNVTEPSAPLLDPMYPSAPRRVV